MKKKAASLLALLAKSKIELATFLLFIGWIVIVFVFYLPQTSKATVAGVATHKNFRPKPTITPTTTMHFNVQGTTPGPTQPPAPTNTPSKNNASTSSGSSNEHASSQSPTPTREIFSQTEPSMTPVPTKEEQVIQTNSASISPTPTQAPNVNQAIISNGVGNSVNIIQVTPTPAGFSTGGTTITVGTPGNGSESTNNVQPTQ